MSLWIDADDATLEGLAQEDQWEEGNDCWKARDEGRANAFHLSFDADNRGTPGIPLIHD